MDLCPKPLGCSLKAFKDHNMPSEQFISAKSARGTLQGI